MSKSKWKKQVKEKIEKSVKDRTKQEMADKTKARTIVEDKWERKKYLQKCDSDTIGKGIILTPNAHQIKNQKTLQSMCWDVKQSCRCIL